MCKFVYKFKNYLNKSYIVLSGQAAQTIAFWYLEGDSSKTAMELWADPKASPISAFTIDLLW